MRITYQKLDDNIHIITSSPISTRKELLILMTKEIKVDSKVT